MASRTRKGSKAENLDDETPLTLNLLREELMNFKSSLKAEFWREVRTELVAELKESIASIFRSEINSLKERIEALEKREEKGKEDVHNQIEDVVEEANQRYERRCKIIISNLEELSSGTVAERKERDRNKVLEIAAELCVDGFGVEDCHRFGKIDLGRPRLLSVTCSDKASKLNILRSARNLRGIDEYRHCYINPDLTLMQRNANKKLLLELKEKRNRGLDVIIKRGRVVPRQSVYPQAENFH